MSKSEWPSGRGGPGGVGHRNDHRVSDTGPPSHIPRKRFGQHFLEPVWADKVVTAIAPRSDETFVEIGPGEGALTRRLAARAAQVVACEIDRDLVAHLRQEDLPRVHLVEGDFLELGADRLRQALADSGATPTLRAAGNLPYNVAAPILFKLLDLIGEGVAFRDATVMLQREVAIRLLAQPGTRDYGVLTILIGQFASVERLLQLPAGAFRPMPKILSTVVRLTFHPADPAVRDLSTFRALTQAVFTRRRKTLANALLAYGPAASQVGHLLASAGIDGRRRPETLTRAEFARLADEIIIHRSSIIDT